MGDVTPTRAGRLLLEWLRENHYTQAGIAEDIGISKQTLYKYIYGLRVPKEHPRWNLLEQMTDGFVKAKDWR